MHSTPQLLLQLTGRELEVISVAKDLTTSRIDRQNILNNDFAIEEIQTKSGIEGIPWKNKIYITREMTANFSRSIFVQSVAALSRTEENLQRMAMKSFGGAIEILYGCGKGLW